jgi:hypothetical protein
LDTIRKSHSDEKDSFPIAFLDKSSTTTFWERCREKRKMWRGKKERGGGLTFMQLSRVTRSLFETWRLASERVTFFVWMLWREKTNSISVLSESERKGEKPQWFCILIADHNWNPPSELRAKTASKRAKNPTHHGFSQFPLKMSRTISLWFLVMLLQCVSNRVVWLCLLL